MRRFLAVSVILMPAVAAAQSPTELPRVDVVGSSPLLGSGVDRNQVPAATNVVTDREVTRTGLPQAVRALEDNIPGVNLSNAAGNPNQPNLFYHGFEASPLQGTPQGIAVYVNGVRFNQAFGDTVHWDLIPDVAIDRMNLVGANPVFGLNALGGGLSVQMKNGFTYQGGEGAVFGGSFGQVGTFGQYGRTDRQRIAATSQDRCSIRAAGATCNPPISTKSMAMSAGAATAAKCISTSSVPIRS